MESELALQFFLAQQEGDLGAFTFRVIHVKITEGFEMTPEEELFMHYFNDEKALVSDMSILELRAHREELVKIIKEARARLSADDRELARKTSKRGEATGFSANVNTDELTSEAINRLGIINKEKQAKLTKDQKILKGLIDMGMDPKEAEKTMSAGAILARIKAKASEEEINKLKHKPNVEVSKASFVNPFAKPVTKEPELEVSIQEETNTIIITEKPIEQSEPKANFVNPFLNLGKK